MKNSRIFILIFCLILTMSTLAACSNTAGNGADTAAESAAPAEVQAAPAEERVITLDEDNLGYPSVYTVSSRGRGYLMMSFLFDTLTWKDENGVVPMLAKSWTVSPDNRVWTFSLVDNAKFADGKALTAEDVKFSFDYMLQHPHQWVSLNMIEEVKVLDTYELQIALKDAYAPFITDVAGNVPIMPMHIWKDVSEPEKFNTPEAVIGSGPFKLESYDKDAGTYVYIANKEYFMGEPVVDKLIFTAHSQPAMGLKNGELDASQRMKYGEAMAMKKEEGKFKVLEGPGLWVYRLYFNFDLPELNSREVRQAIYTAINREEIVEKVLKNGGTAGNPGHIHPDSEWYSKDVTQYGFDAAKASEMLDNAGFKDSDKNGVREYKGKEMAYEMLITEDKVNEAEMIKEYLKNIGIQVNVKAMDQKSVDTMIKEGKFQIALNGHGSFGGDPVLLARFISKDVKLGSTPAVTAQGGKSWSNKEFDEIFVEQLKETDRQKRYDKVARLQQIISDELPTLTLYYRKITFAYNEEKLNGWFFTKDGVAIAVPTTQNKLVYINGKWGK